MIISKNEILKSSVFKNNTIQRDLNMILNFSESGSEKEKKWTRLKLIISMGHTLKLIKNQLKLIRNAANLKDLLAINHKIMEMILMHLIQSTSANVRVR